MNCPKCRFENPGGFGFCGKCGQRLGQVAEAGKEMPAPEGERKYVTVLLSDLLAEETAQKALALRREFGIDWPKNNGSTDPNRRKYC